MRQPWSIWWDFRSDDGYVRWIVVQTDHPDYERIDYIYCLPIELCEDSKGQVDDWVKEWFRPFRDDLLNARKSIHTLMKQLGHTKGK
jgi:hypothetical protein